MYCTRCGSPNDEGAEVCRNCTAPLVTRTTSSPPYREHRPEQSTPPSPVPPETPSSGYQPSLPPGYRAYAPQTPQSYSPPLPQSASGKSIASMVLSLISIVTCGPLLSIPGMILGKSEMNAIADGRSPSSGETYAKIGFYVGIGVTLLSCLGIVAWCVMMALNVGFGFMH